ncbi:MAG: hypothetical protein CMF63_00670 [Magnetovibrio sp.]|nr:hypothetical protein [Magnetovibrio sp.]
MLLTIDLIAQGKSPTKIDSVVRISDTAAIQGLDRLDAEGTKFSANGTSKPSKSQAVATLRKAMGYGGMIHNFKNFVLRHEHVVLELTRRNIATALETINIYAERSLTDAEHQAIRDIAGVIKAYGAALTKVNKLSDQSEQPADIDRAVQIDDGPALRGFDILVREITLQNEREAAKVNEALALVTSITETTAFVTLAIISLLIIASLWLIRAQITGPIKRMTGVMARLAAGNLDIEVHATGQNNEIGEMARAVEIFRNIAIERHKAEKKIIQFKSTLDRTQDCIFMFRPDTLKFYYVNQGAMDQVGYAEDELFEMTPVDIKPEGDEAGFRSIAQPLIEGPQRSSTYETVHQHRNGELIPVEISLQYIAPTNEESRFVAIVRDITERKKIDKTKSEFISTVSHELRTPLTSIKGSLGLIQSGAIGELPDKLKSMLTIAYNNSDRLVRLINDILDIEKIDAGKMDFQMAPLSLGPLLEQAIEANRGYGEEHGVHFVLSSDPPEAKVEGDHGRLMQVLANLMSNAAKFSPDGSAVEISLSKRDTGFRVEVADHGPGIPDKFRDKIFGKFSQADSSDTRQKGGTGLGLNITKAIVERHGGTVGFETEAGEGATFFFDLPALREHEDVQVTTSTEASQYHVLICEDEPDIAKLLELMLKLDGFATDTASSAAEAEELLGKNTYDAMTLDLVLPDKDGITLLQELRENPKTKHLPIIVVSATATEGAKELNGDAIGVIDWLEKPIDQARLSDSLRRAVAFSSGGKGRILHVEDDPDILQVVSALVEGLAKIVPAKTLSEAKSLLEQQSFDLVVLDLTLPDGDGMELLPLLKGGARRPTPVIAFSAKDISEQMAGSIKAALVKSKTSNEALLATIRSSIEEQKSRNE